MKSDPHCLITNAAAGPCQQCGKYVSERMHLCDDKALCPECCPECKVSHVWTEMVQPVAGEQMDLSVLLEGD